MTLQSHHIATRTFRSAESGSEHILIVQAPAELDFVGQIQALKEGYEEAQRKLDIAPTTAIFRRIFLSDAINQMELLEQSGLLRDLPGSPVAVSLVEQPPLPASKVALLAYHVESETPLKKTRLTDNHILVEKNGLRHLWSTRLCGKAQAANSPEEVQTREIFRDLVEELGRFGANLRDHCVRTWLFMKDVDVFYMGMVRARLEYFLEHGLNKETHYIASTGIEGSCEHQFDRVSMDSYSLLDLKPSQVSYLNDFDRLCPTIDYNVTFERGTRIAFSDRAHHYISGTASIDNTGRVLHLGDVSRQLDRTLENIDALLRSGGASLADMMYFIVYLRDSSDQALIQRRLAERFPATPFVIVQGAVCRPEWLIEIEGVAIAPHSDKALPTF
ncbi:MAG: hypothetical protein HGA90_00595 [Alphaproteobacteria bacterium]|nr:hypothetical protein [Alphaproteobacteria bacterium]